VPDRDARQQRDGAAAGGRRKRRGPVMLAVTLIAVALIVGGVAGVRALSTKAGPAAGISRAGVAVKVGGIPASIAVDQPADTVYIAAADGGLVMLRASACRAADARGCRGRQAPAGGPYAASVVVDGPAHTVYVAGGPAGTIAVIDAGTCNAVTARGCSAPAGLIHLPGAPQALALDPRTGTLYADVAVPLSRQRPSGSLPARQLAVISTKTCNVMVTHGCTKIITAPLGSGLYAAIAVDQATGSVYAAAGSKVVVINGRACAAGNASGCAKTLATVQVYGYIAGIDADEGGTVYVTSPGSGTVTAIRAAACGVPATDGCASAVLLRAGAGPVAAVTDGATRTLYVTNAATNAVSMVDVAACGAVGGGCPHSVPAFAVGATPISIGLDRAVRTLYVGNLRGESVSLVSTVGCDAVTQQGCPVEAPAGTAPVPRTPYTCPPAIAAYQSGQPAGPFTRASVRVAGGTVDGQAWAVWARRGVFYPNGIEQGGLVLGGRWYALCSGSLDGGADAANAEMIAAPHTGIVYGYVQHPVPVTVTLAASGPLPRPVSVWLHGTTFFIEVLPRSACAYPALTLHGRAPDWSGAARLTFGACEPGRLVDVAVSQSAWGPVTGR